MSTGSAVPATLDALVAILTAALPNAAVYDGAGVTDSPDLLAVHVGMGDPDSDSWDEAVASAQSWAWLGHNQRDETFSVRCCAIGWNGDGSPKAARDAAYTAITAVTNTIQSDPTLGGVVLFVEGIESHTLSQVQDSAGAAARLPFDIKCRARLS